MDIFYSIFKESSQGDTRLEISIGPKNVIVGPIPRLEIDFQQLMELSGLFLFHASQCPNLDIDSIFELIAGYEEDNCIQTYKLQHFKKMLENMLAIIYEDEGQKEE